MAPVLLAVVASATQAIGRPLVPHIALGGAVGFQVWGVGIGAAQRARTGCRATYQATPRPAGC
jgi:hypothetical protein